jgi:hypothetical protein
VEDVARGIALALADSGLRKTVFEAMRASATSRHSLVLQDFARGEGSAVLAAAAVRLGTTEAKLRATIDALPALDFYFPLHRHRASWHGTESVMVGAANVKGTESIRLFGQDGGEESLLRGVAAGERPFIILRPSNASRPAPFTNALGEVPVDCDPATLECSGGGGTGGYPITHGVYIDRFFPGQDDGWFGGVEVDMRFAYYQLPQGVTVTDIRRDVDPYEWHDEDILVWARTCNIASPPPIEATVTEIDGGLNGGDEDWGTLRYPPRTFGVDEESWLGGNFMIALRMICK